MGRNQQSKGGGYAGNKGNKTYASGGKGGGNKGGGKGNAKIKHCKGKSKGGGKAAKA